MKKQYICPEVTVVRVETQQLMVNSPLTTSSLDGFGEYGGDAGSSTGDGSKDADARITVPNAWEEW